MASPILTQALTVRDAFAHEREAMVQLTLLANKAYEKDAPSGMWPSYEKSIAEAIIGDDPSLAAIERIVAIIEGQMVGSVLLYPPSSKTLQLPEIRLLAVDPAYRNRGIAKSLMLACEQRVKESGLSSVCLHTTRLMLVARDMYERMGYKRFPDIDFEPSTGFIVWGYLKSLSGNSP